MSKIITLKLTEEQADGLWSLAEVGRTAGLQDGPDSVGMTPQRFNAGSRAMDKLPVTYP